MNPAPNDIYGLVNACRKLHSAIDQFDALVAKRMGIFRTDLRCLNLLEDGPILPKNIGSQLDLTSGTVTALLDRLEKKGLIVRRPHPSDRRAVLIEATPKVFVELGGIYRQLGEAIVKIADSYDPEEVKDASRHLNDISDACSTVISDIEVSSEGVDQSKS
ncbi:MAG: MarR family transcriptional regulator [Verrucomicrobiota bacterium]